LPEYLKPPWSWSATTPGSGLFGPTGRSRYAKRARAVADRPRHLFALNAVALPAALDARALRLVTTGRKVQRFAHQLLRGPSGPSDGEKGDANAAPRPPGR
jgi:hypothetical protein